jgi:[protein-PII] uridylyltransferase
LQELARQTSRLPSRLDVFTVPPRVLFDNKASRRHTVIEVNGRDRPGLLYRVTQVLTRQNLIIHSAQIATFGVHAVDVFYVHNALGEKIAEEAKLKRLRARLLEVLEPSAEAATKPSKAAKKAKKPPGEKAGRKSRKQAGKTFAEAEE